MMGKWTLASKIRALVFLVCGLFAAQEAFYVLPTFKSKLFEQKKAENQAVVEVGFGVLEYFAAQESTGVGNTTKLRVMSAWMK